MPSPYKLHINQWQLNVRCSSFSARMIQKIAVSAEMVYELMSHVRSRRLDELLPNKPEPQQWLRYYRGNLKIIKTLGDWHPDAFGSGDELVALLKGSRKISLEAKQQTEDYAAFIDRIKEIKPDHQRRLIQRMIREEQREYGHNLEELRDTMAEKDHAKSETFGNDIEQIPELLFYFRVVLPSLVAYQMHPGHLLRKARQCIEPASERVGELTREQAMENLVRVDEMAIYDPRIEAWANRQKDGGVRLARQRLLRQWAEQGMDYGRFNFKQVQQSLGGLIQAVIEQFGRYIDWSKPHLGWQEPKVTANDIRNLFLAVDKDRHALCPEYTGSAMGLMDLQTPSWTRRLSEHRDMWIKTLPKTSDKT